MSEHLSKALEDEQTLIKAAIGAPIIDSESGSYSDSASPDSEPSELFDESSDPETEQTSLSEDGTEVEFDKQDSDHDSTETTAPTHLSHSIFQDTDSQHWTNVPSSLASSVPSMSFPEQTNPPSPTQSHSELLHGQDLLTQPHRSQRDRSSRQHHTHAHHTHHHHHHQHHQHHTGTGTEEGGHTADQQTLSASKAIFDSSLPTKIRVSALVSSLAINMLLPFVNGVMLGFGEIFAKNVLVGWFGWKKVPGPWTPTTTVNERRRTTTDVGIGRR